MAKPGDIVHHEGQDRVVVDVTDDGFAVLRSPDDVDLKNPVVTPAADLRVVGHLEGLNGWIEDSPGEWRKEDS